MHLTEHLMALESELLQNSTRKNAARLMDLLAHGFREFGSSGRTYSKADIISALQQEPSLRIAVSDFNVTQLSETAALVTYTSHKERPDALPSAALRSSVWILQENTWRILFHQGTPKPARGGD